MVAIQLPDLYKDPSMRAAALAVEGQTRLDWALTMRAGAARREQLALARGSLQRSLQLTAPPDREHLVRVFDDRLATWLDAGARERGSVASWRTTPSDKGGDQTIRWTPWDNDPGGDLRRPPSSRELVRRFWRGLWGALLGWGGHDRRASARARSRPAARCAPGAICCAEEVRMTPEVTVASDPAGALAGLPSARRLAVAVPDHTRPIDVPAALRALQDRAALRVVVGLGLHRPMRADELAPLEPWAPIQHDPENVASTATVDGVPGAVSRHLLGLDAIISVGVAELHQYAGLSGGHKGVAVGCGGRATIAALHQRDRVLAPGVRIGQLDGNPFRAAVDALGEAAGVRFALVWVPAARVWIGGPPRAVLAEALARIDPWEPVEGGRAGAVLRVPASKASSFYQASRAATYLGLSPRPPVAEGGRLILEAACPEGLGAEAGFVAALLREPPPWGGLLRGAPPEGAGAQRAVMIALLARRFQLEVAGCAQPEALRAAGIAARAEPAELEPGWLDVRRPFERIPQGEAT